MSLDRGLPPQWTDKSVTFTVWGNPVPKQSFQYNRRGDAYTPTRIKNWQDTVGWAAKEAMIDHDIFEGDLFVEITFYRGDKRRVDLDNLSKAILDGCNMIVWEDDDTKIIQELHLKSEYDKEHPSVTIKVAIIGAI